MASSKKKKKTPTKKTVKKTAKKPAKKVAKKPAKKVIRKAAKKAPEKSTEKPAKATKPVEKVTKTSKTTKLDFTPLHNHLLVQQEGESDRTPGGLYIPAMAQDRPLKGKVIAIGKGGYNKKGKLRPLDVRVGETVLFGPHAGSKVAFSGQELLILKEDEVLAVVKS